MAVFCILLKDGIATKKTKTLIPKGKNQSQQYQSLQGSLWVLDQNEYDGSRFYQQKSDHTRLTIKLKALEDESVTHTCQASDVARLTDVQCELLQAVSTCGDRYKVFQDQPWMTEALKINCDSVVYVINCQGVPDKAVAIVRYKGKVNNSNGIWFGLEFSEKFAGSGTTDGTYRKVRHFHCGIDDGLFVPISKIRRAESSLFKQSTQGANLPVEHQDNSPGEPPPQLSIGERVVWVDDDGQAQMAIVHWIGRLPDAHDQEWTVGVEFENRIGTGTGKYRNTQLFKARNGHASLIPVMGLMKAEEFYGSVENIPSPVERPEMVSAGPMHGDSIQSTKSTQGNVAKQPILDENYYRESYKTNRPPKVSPENVTQETLNKFSSKAEAPPGGEYDILRNRQKNSGVDPIYACVDDVRNEPVTDGAHRNYKGSQSEVIYTLPNKAKTATKSHHTDSSLLNKRTIVVNSEPHTIKVDVHDGLEDSKRAERYNNLSTPTSPPYNLRSSPNITTSPGYNISPVGGNYKNTGSSPGARKKQSPVMHEDIKESGVGSSYTQSNYPPTSTYQYENTTSKVNTSREPKVAAKTLTAAEVGSEFDVGSVVEVAGNPEYCKYGVIRWIGYLQDKTRPIVGLEMEDESSACTDGTFGGQRMFECSPRKAFFVYLSKVSKDSRFEENERYLQRTMSQAFGSLDCPDIEEDIPPVDEIADLTPYIGQNKGIQGHHNSCYLDTSLFSMFAFTQTFDAVMFRERDRDDIEKYEDVQRVLKDGIVNPLRKNFFVRADKVLKLRTLLDKLSSVQGLMTEEKDPEEFLTCLLQQILRADPLLKFSNGQTSFLYQLFVEKDEKIVLPTTEQLLELSFMQADMKLSEAPHCLILQMPRFGKDFKMYKKIVPSLYLDITDILEHGPRECHLCGGLATHECKDCFQMNLFESGLVKTAFCSACLKKCHQHKKRQSHKHKVLQRNKEYEEYLEMQKQRGHCSTDAAMPREIMELFAVICIETSHYVAFVKCGHGKDAPWVLFDSMADRMGAQNGYNIPEVKRCSFLPHLLQDEGKLLQETENKNDKELGDLKRLLCDGYICMYRSEDLQLYN